MNAIEFWDAASVELKKSLCDRAHVSHVAIVNPFWLLPNELKGTIYEATEFRMSTKRARAAQIVASNWRLRTRLPRVTKLASTLGLIKG